METLTDLPNAFICLLAIILALHLRIIPNWIGFILAIYSFIPFFLNNVLFPTTYMADQFLYAKALKEVRLLNYFYDENPKSLYTAWFLSLMPLPLAETVKSMGFYNRFLFLVMFLWLYKKNFLSGMSLNFLIFYPSLILYTSLSLREPFILFLMVVSTIFFLDKKYWLCCIFTIPLFFVKFQNFILIILFYLFFIIFQKKTILYKYRYILIFFIVLCTGIFFNDLISILEKHRSSMYDGGDILTYKSLKEGSNFIFLILTSSAYFLMKPFPWEAVNIFQQIQSIENIFVLFFLTIFTKRAYSKDSFITIRWLSYFIFALTIYGLVVFNYGSAVRYKFAFIVMYVVGLSYELFNIHGYRFSNIFKIYIKNKEKNTNK